MKKKIPCAKCGLLRWPTPKKHRASDGKEFCRPCRASTSGMRPRVSRSCLMCGADFTGSSTRKYCSRECSALGYSMAAEARSDSRWRSCPACGKRFRATSSHGQVACGRACASKLRPVSPAPEPKPTRPTLLKACACCDAFFTSTSSAIYCSRECSLAVARLRQLARYVPKPRVSKCVDLTCTSCGVTFTARSASALYCSNRCRKIANGRGHRDRARKYGVAYTSFSPLAIYVRDSWTCGLCGDAVNATSRWPDQMCASLDHIVPLSLGGAHHPDNVRLAHWLCNSLRGVDDIDFMRAG